MEWIIFFIVSWSIFFFLVDWKEFKLNSLCGLLALGMQLAVDTSMIAHGFYKVNDHVLNIWGSSAFFGMGAPFAFGTLLAQYQSCKRGFRILNVLVLAAIYTLQEINLIYSGALEYIDWNLIDSIMVNICAMIVLSWFSIVVLNKKGHAAN